MSVELFELGVDLLELGRAVLDDTRDPARRAHVLRRCLVGDRHHHRVTRRVEVRAGRLLPELVRDRLRTGR